jgi:phosphoribosyl-AMP cyclohydrolase
MRFTLSGFFVSTEAGFMNQEIDFDKMKGLAPAIVQDAASGEVLMLGFMNREAYERTFVTGYVTFFSRTRNQLWTKGETSGNRLKLVSAAIDCDRDTLLLQVRVEGGGLVCHEGTRSCFTRPLTQNEAQKEDTSAQAVRS